MTPKQFLALPECFKDKIKIDEAIADFKLSSVIDFKAARHLLLMQQTYRLRCIAAVKKNGAGSATTV